MFALDSNHRYFMCRQPVNMRKGIDALFNLIQSESPLSPMTGDVFVFFSRNRQGREASALGHGRLPSLSEASGERLV